MKNINLQKEEKKKRTVKLRLPDDPVITLLHDISAENNLNLFIVGGYVRDLLLGDRVKDFDVMVEGDGIETARIFANKAQVPSQRVVTYQKFGTAMVKLPERMVEFVGARSEKYRSSSRKPEVKKATVDEDLSRRDFTINAIAVSLHPDTFGTLLDPFNGRKDLKNKIIRTPLNPDETFDDDPLRMIRGIRFTTQLNFTIDEKTLRGIEKNRERVSIVSQERITDELLKIIGAERPSGGFILLKETGLLDIIFPEISTLAGVDQKYEYHHKDVFYHTLQVVDNISQKSDDIFLRLTALLHDIAKPQTKAYHPEHGWTFHGHEEVGARMIKGIFRKLKLPLQRAGYVEKLVRLHLRPMALVDDQVTDSAIRRLLFEAGEDIDDLITLCRADITSKNPRLVSKYMGNYERVVKRMQEVEEKDRLRNWQPPIRGDEIMERFGLEQGPTVGKLKKAVENAILDGIIPNEYKAALDYLYRIKDDVLKK